MTRVLALALSLGLVGGSIQPASAQLTGLIEIGAGTLAVKHLLGKFEDTANRLLSDGATTGDALTSKFGNELWISTRNVEIALANRQSALFKDLAPREQELITQLNNTIKSANDAVGQASRLAEVANLNLIETTNRIKLITEKTRFYVSSVRGLSQTYTSADYNIIVRGLGVGIPAGDQKYDVSVKIGDHILSANYLEAQNATDLKIIIPNTEFERYFQNNKNVQVPMELYSEITSPKDCLFCFNRTETKSYSASFKIMLFAKNAVELIGTQIIENVVPGDEIKTHLITVHTAGCEPRRPCNWTRTHTLADDEVAVGVRFSHAGEGCPWNYALRVGGYGADYDIIGKQIIVYRHSDGELPCDSVYYIDYKKLVHQESEKPIVFTAVDFHQVLSSSDGNAAALDQKHTPGSAPVVVNALIDPNKMDAAINSANHNSSGKDGANAAVPPTRNESTAARPTVFETGFNKAISFATDSSNNTCAYRIIAKYITKQISYIDHSLPQSADGLLVRTGSAKEGNHCRVNLMINAPQ